MVLLAPVLRPAGDPQPVHLDPNVSISTRRVHVLSVLNPDAVET